MIAPGTEFSSAHPFLEKRVGKQGETGKAGSRTAEHWKVSQILPFSMLSTPSSLSLTP